MVHILVEIKVAYELYDHGLDWTAPIYEKVGVDGHTRIFHFILHEFTLSNIFLFQYTSGPEREKQTYIHFSFHEHELCRLRFAQSCKYMKKGLNYFSLTTEKR